MLKDNVINYENQQDQKISDFLQKVVHLQDDNKSKIYLIPPFLPQQLGKFNLAVDSQEIGFSNVRKKHEFLNGLKEYFGQEEVNMHDIAAIQNNHSEIIIEYSSESLKAKLRLSELATDKTIDSQWNEKLEENTKQNKKQKIEEEDLAQRKKEEEKTNTDSPLREQEQFREFCGLNVDEFEQLLKFVPKELSKKMIVNAVNNLSKISQKTPSEKISSSFAEKVFDPEVLNQVK